MACTHDDIETIIEKIAYHKHIRDLEFETREVLEREMLNKNIENIVTRIDKTQIDDNQMTHPTHLRAMILIRPMTVIIDVNYTNIRNIGKGSDKTMRNFNGKIADDSV